MFLGLIVAAVIAVTAFILAAKAVKRFLKLFSGKDKNRKSPGDRKKDAGKGPKEASETAKESAAEEEVTKEEEAVPEEFRNRYAAASSEGIGEDFWNEETAFRIDGKTIADSCVEGSSLTYLEYSNRELTGDEFHGFNLIVEEGSRMVLTYGGVAVATLTRTERTCTAMINGETVTGTMPAYRTNTFPPELRPGMVASDLERMLEASLSIRSCGGNPEAVSRAMVELFKGPENITLLKTAIDRKIQAKESLRKGPRSQKTLRSPTRL